MAKGTNQKMEMGQGPNPKMEMSQGTKHKMEMERVKMESVLEKLTMRLVQTISWILPCTYSRT